jgi:hypothetical protein
VQQAVAVNWSRLDVARARLQASNQQIAAAQAAFEAVRAEAELGARTTLDVLNAEQELLDAQFVRIEASAILQLASYALLESTGQLTVTALNLGIPVYDVEAYSSAFRPAARTPSVQGSGWTRSWDATATDLAGAEVARDPAESRSFIAVNAADFAKVRQRVADLSNLGRSACAAKAAPLFPAP